jgi:hypothetical protein
MTARMELATPVRFTSITSCHPRSLTCMIPAGTMMPAFATSTSSFPNCATACSTAAWSAAGLRTSPRNARNRRPCASTSRPVSAKSWGVAGG